MRFLDGHDPAHDLAYEDAFLVPGFSEVESRLEVDLTPPDPTGLTIPVVGANMTAVAGRRMVETLARRGALGIIPQDIPVDVVREDVATVKSRHPVFETPVVLAPTDTVGMALGRLHKRAHDAVVVVTDDRPTGVVMATDLADVGARTQLAAVMSRELVTVRDTVTAREAFEQLHDAGRRLAPVVDADGALVGVVTQRGAVRSTLFAPALDGAGRLRVAAAVGISGDPAARAERLVDAGVDVLVVDTAHGHQRRMLEVLSRVRAAAPDAPLVAGNVATPAGVQDLVGEGADVVKVGVGPGAMCTTRMIAAAGRPQLSAVIDCAAAARELGAHVWADGGIRHPRDVALALAGGASAVVIGSWFAGTYESPGELHEDSGGNAYKRAYGMASARAVEERSAGAEPFVRATRRLFEEGISSGRIRLDPDRPGVEDLLDLITAGVRSAMTYAGAADPAGFHAAAVLGVQSRAGYDEGRPEPEGWRSPEV